MQTSLIHHDKHGAHPLVFFSQKRTNALAFAPQSHGAGRAAMNSHFFFNTGTDYIIEFTQGAVIIHPNFGKIPAVPSGAPSILASTG